VLSRSFQVSPRTRLTYDLRVSNILNRVTHAGVNTSVGSPQFGLPTLYAPPRQLNMSLGMSF
jgi:hypothetical protein